jgi:hypothetical protein
LEPLSIWSRIFEWATPFRFESQELLEDCGERIQHLDQRPGTFSRNPTIEASVMGLGAYGEDVYPFTMAVIRHGKYGSYRSAELSGVLKDDPEAEVTIAKGVAQLTSGAIWSLFVCVAVTLFSPLIFLAAGLEWITLGLLAVVLLSGSLPFLLRLYDP